MTMLFVSSLVLLLVLIGSLEASVIRERAGPADDVVKTLETMSGQLAEMKSEIDRLNKHIANADCRPILIQQHVDGSRFFDRTWAEFKVGFSGANGNYWIGNEVLHQLTREGRYKLRFDLRSLDNGQWYWAEYSSVTVGNEASGYAIYLGTFTGNVYRDAMRYVNGMRTYQDGMKFTTKDRDQDTYGPNCAVYNAGGFWYSNCARASVNSAHGFSAEDFAWWDLTSSGLRRLKATQMWLKCR